MAKREKVSLVDDLDGGEAHEQVRFAIDGRSYQIDLSAENSGKLRDALAPYISAARRKTRGRSSAATEAPARPATDRRQNHAIREWALQQGLTISERGRIPTNVIEAYRSAH